MIINREKTLSAFANDDEIFFSVLEEFSGNFENQKKELIESIDKKEVDNIRIRVHTVKGLAATFYNEDLKNVASNAEQAAKEGNIELVRELKEDLVLKFEELFQEAKRILNER